MSLCFLFPAAVPQIAAQPEMKEITAGSMVVFPCLASGFPVPEIKWTKVALEWVGRKWPLLRARLETLCKRVGLPETSPLLF